MPDTDRFNDDRQALFAALVSAGVPYSVGYRGVYMNVDLTTALTLKNRVDAAAWLMRNHQLSHDDATVLVNQVRHQAVQASEARKDDTGKLPWDLMPQSIEEVVKIFQHGATQYGKDNWRAGNGLAYSRVYSALQRHLANWWWRHEQKDQESGCHPLAAVAWCALVLLEYEQKGSGQDDRYGYRPPLVKWTTTNVQSAPEEPPLC